MSLPDKATYSTYGGEKQDYSAPEDPTTDRSAAELNEALADVSAMTRIAPRAIVEFASDSGAGECVLISHDAVWGNDVSVAPTLAYLDVGIYQVTFPATVTDARGNQHSVNLRWGHANTNDLANGFVVSASKLAPNSFRVACMSVIDSAYEDSDAPIQLFVY